MFNTPGVKAADPFQVTYSNTWKLTAPNEKLLITKSQSQDGICGHVTCAVPQSPHSKGLHASKGSPRGSVLWHHSLKIPNDFFSKGPYIFLLHWALKIMNLVLHGAS